MSDDKIEADLPEKTWYTLSYTRVFLDGPRERVTRTTIVRWGAIVRDVLVLTVLALITISVGCPQYRVWSQQKTGEAEFARADQNRRITVLEAQAKQEAAKALAQAEIERAKGVAEANRIVADSLKGHDEYLRYLWIDKVAEGTNREVIYVPTEAAIPILEATRLEAKTP